MTNLRRYLLGFIYRSAVCLILFILCYIVHSFWPRFFYTLREGLFYDVNYGRLVKELKEAVGCLIPA